MTQPFRPGELSEPGAPDDAAELATALEMARLIERSVGADGVRPSPGFSDRVMAEVASQPAPHQRGLAIFLAAARTMWQTALNVKQPRLVRARALAVLLAALLVLGSMGGAATLAAAGALNLFASQPSSGPVTTSVPERNPSPRPTRRTTKSPEPTEEVGPGDTPEASETPEPGASDDDGAGSGGGDGTVSPWPSRTPEPDDTPKPGSTPEPSDD